MAAAGARGRHPFGAGPKPQGVPRAAEDPVVRIRRRLSGRGHPVEGVELAGRRASSRVAGTTAALATVSAGGLVVLALVGSARLDAPLGDGVLGLGAPDVPPVVLNLPAPGDTLVSSGTSAAARAGSADPAAVPGVAGAPAASGTGRASGGAAGAVGANGSTTAPGSSAAGTG